MNKLSKLMTQIAIVVALFIGFNLYIGNKMDIAREEARIEFNKLQEESNKKHKEKFDALSLRLDDISRKVVKESEDARKMSETIAASIDRAVSVLEDREASEILKETIRGIQDAQ